MKAEIPGRVEVKKVQALLTDNDASSNSINVGIEQINVGLLIKPKGYGDKCSNDGDGCPVFLEVYKGELRLIVWSDINQEDPTHIINLEGAKETKRQ